MKKTKILFIDHTPFAGGAQICLANHIKVLNRKKFEPLLLIDRNSKFEHIYKDSNVKIYKIGMQVLKKISPKSLINLGKSFKEGNDLVGKLKPDVVMANTTRALIVALLMKKNFKLINYVRDYEYPKWLMALAKKRVDKFLMVSKSINDYYKGSGEKFEVVYLGTTIKNKKTPLKRNKIVVGYSGRLVDWKGPMFLIDAFIRLHTPGVWLLIFGSGKDQAGDVEQKLKEKIKKFKLERKVKLMGFVNNQVSVYQAMDIFVLSSLKDEPFATNMIEASFFKLPIVATSTGGTVEFIRDQENGLLVEPGNTTQLTKALEKLIADKKLAKKLGEQAFLDAQNFTEENLARKLEKIYE